jgi:hypothetical protein
MNEVTSHKLIWGYLRLFLGWLQMSLAAAGFGALLIVGNHPVTWAFVIGAVIATIVSRLAYHGKADPKLKGTTKERVMQKRF